MPIKKIERLSIRACRFILEDSHEGDIKNPLSLNLYTYCYNNPIIFIDPTGNVVTAWDKQHCTDDEITRLEQLTNDWLAGDTSAHNKAETIRTKYRDAREYGTNDGNTGGPSRIYHQFYMLETLRKWGDRGFKK